MGILGGNKYFSADYATSRHRFRRAAEAAGAELDALEYPERGPDGQPLTLDIARVGPPDARSVVVVSSGLHGVEGFMGAAVQLALLAEPLQVPDGVALVLLHALNPYGFAYLRRVDANNIDLNRNFLLPGESWSGAPPGYEVLDPILNPPKPPNRLSELAFLSRAALQIARSGLEPLKAIVAGGQYTHPLGLFYGGSGPSPTYELVDHLVRTRFVGVERLLQIDLHTGLGRPATYRLLADHAAADPRVAWLELHFGGTVQPWDAEGGVAYPIRGGLGAWMRAALPDAHVEVLAAEFGTLPIMRVIAALHLENRAHHWCGPDDPRDRWAKQRLKEVFAPSRPGWRDAVVDKGHRIVQQALGAAVAPLPGAS